MAITGDYGAMYADQQRVIIDLMEHYVGAPEPVVAGALRQEFARHDLPCPPWFWVRTVAGEISANRLYVVANGTVPGEYFGNRAERRERVETASRRGLAAPGGDLPETPDRS